MLKRHFTNRIAHLSVTSFLGTLEPCVRLLVTDPLYKKELKLWKSIPVHDKKFDYTFYTDHPQVVHLTKWEEYDRSEGWYQIPFFIEEGSNHADVSEQDGKLILHKSTDLNREWENHCKRLNEIVCKHKLDAIYDRMGEMSRQETYTPEGTVVYAQLDSLFTANKSRGFSKKEALLRNELFEQIEVLRKANKLYSAAYLALQRQADNIGIEMEKAALDYFGDHAPTLAGLYYLEEKVYAYTHNDKNNDRYLLPYALYRKHFIRQWKDNPLAKNIESMVDAKHRFKVGEKYLPYQADDLNGKAVSVDKVIRGKWALVDLWTPWCGPCRTHARELIPLHKCYQPKGFVIVGIAREDELKDVRAALEEEKYPWLQLVDLKDKYQIWLKHGLENATGGTILIDPQGKIAAINPTLKELKKMLATAYKD